MLISFFNARYPTDSLRGPVQTLRRGAERRVGASKSLEHFKKLKGFSIFFCFKMFYLTDGTDGTGWTGGTVLKSVL